MTQPASNVIPITGQIPKDGPQTFSEALRWLEQSETRETMLKRELDGYRLRLAQKEKELVRAQGTDPEAGDVRTVLDHWAKRVLEEGWWSKRPAFRPGHPRWSACAARLREPEYDVEYCLAVVEGALFQSRQGVKREWVDASSIFKAGNIERHFERAQDPYCQRVRLTRKLPEAVQVLLTDPGLPYLCEPCDCGHLRLEHSKGDPARDGAQACLVHGCVCEDFDDLHVRCEAWKAQRGAA